MNTGEEHVRRVEPYGIYETGDANQNEWRRLEKCQLRLGFLYYFHWFQREVRLKARIPLSLLLYWRRIKDTRIENVIQMNRLIEIAVDTSCEDVEVRQIDDCERLVQWSLLPTFFLSSPWNWLVVWLMAVLETFLGSSCRTISTCLSNLDMFTGRISAPNTAQFR